MLSKDLRRQEPTNFHLLFAVILFKGYVTMEYFREYYDGDTLYKLLLVLSGSIGGMAYYLHTKGDTKIEMGLASALISCVIVLAVFKFFLITNISPEQCIELFVSALVVSGVLILYALYVTDILSKFVGYDDFILGAFLLDIPFIVMILMKRA